MKRFVSQRHYHVYTTSVKDAYKLILHPSFRRALFCNWINCPECRDFVPKPGGVDTDKWAEEFPTNHLLVNIIDTYNAKSESRIAESRQCSACARERETVQASSWCADCCEALCVSCARHHRKQKQSITHKMTDITKMNEPEMPCKTSTFIVTFIQAEK